MFRNTIYLLLSFYSVYAFSDGTIQYSQFQRLNTPNNPGEEINSFGEINYSDNFNLKKYKAESKIAAGIRYYPTGKATMFSLGELYIEKKRGLTRVRMGRQILDWHDGETFWGLGLFNGVKGFNLLDDDREGLTGIEMQRQMWGGTFKVFGSFLNIPTLNPGYIFRNGQIIGHNEWSKIPPSVLNFREGTAPVYYELMDPEFSEILFRPSYGLSFQKQLGQLNVSLFGIIKPENKLRTGAYGYYEQGNIDQARMKVRAYSINHSVGGAVFAFPLKEVDVKIGTMVSRPDINYHDEFRPESYENYQYETDLYDEEHQFASLSHSFEGGFFKLHYISSSRELAMEARRNSGGTNVFGSVLRFERAIGMDYELNFFDQWRVNLKTFGDLNLGDKIFKGELSYFHHTGASVTGGLQLLKIPEDESFWATYRSNDTMYANFSYNF